MRRTTLRATPAMLRRAAELYRPHGHSPVLLGRKPLKNTKQTDQQFDQKAERKGNPQKQ